MRSATKLAIGAVVVVGAGYGGYNAYATWRLSRANYPDLVPGRVNFVALNPGLGYRIVVANGVAQLTEASNAEFGAPSGSSGEGALDTNRKRIPIANMLKSLQGDPKALGEFVMAINEMKDSDLPPPPRKVWKAEDILKALSDDAVLAAKLETELNVKLDGTPIEQISTDALLNGIVLDLPVTVRVPIGKETREFTARVLEGYKPRLMRDVEKRLESKDITRESIAGYYRLEAEEVLRDPAKRENVAQSLLERVKGSRLQTFAETPERILRNAKVILNENQITKAATDQYQLNEKTYNNLSIDLSEEGQMRLWKYSRGRTGFQLLVVVDGIAIAAPKIIHELSQRDIKITQLPDANLVRNAVEVMNGSQSGGL